MNLRSSKNDQRVKEVIKRLLSQKQQIFINMDDEYDQDVITLISYIKKYGKLYTMLQKHDSLIASNLADININGQTYNLSINTTRQYRMFIYISKQI